MSYVERQKNCTWTSPNGNVFILRLAQEYEETKKHIGEIKANPSRSYGTKNSKKTYRTVNASADTFHDMGPAGADIPLAVVFTGDNHDIEAEKLWNALSEKGKSKLQLIYGGVINVQVIEYKRKSGLIKNCSSTVINIQFHEVSGNIYPRAETDTVNEAAAHSAEAMKDLTEEFVEAAKSVDNPEILMMNLQKGVVKAGTVFSNIQNSTFTGILSDIASYSFPVNSYVLSTQAGRLFSTAFSSFTNAASVLYALQAVLNNFNKNTSISRDKYIANNFLANSAIVTAAESILKVEYETRKEAVKAAEQFQEIHDEYREYSESVEAKFNETLEDYIYSGADINKVVQSAVGAVIEKVDNLKVEQHIVLSSPSNLINLACKYYTDMFKENPESAVDYLIKTNDFKDDDFLYLDRGREVLIYV